MLQYTSGHFHKKQNKKTKIIPSVLTVVNVFGAMADATRRLQWLIEILSQKNLVKGVFVVGGCVRNSILGYPSNDVDLLILGPNVREDQVLQKIESSLGEIAPCKTVNLKTHGSKRLVIKHDFEDDGNGKLIIDMNYAGDGATLLDDMLQRDFTVNGLAIALEDCTEGIDKSNVLDPIGIGLQDLGDKVLRGVTPVRCNSFQTF